MVLFNDIGAINFALPEPNNTQRSNLDRKISSDDHTESYWAR